MIVVTNCEYIGFIYDACVRVYAGVNKYSYCIYRIYSSVLVPQSCPTLCNPVDCSPLDSSVHRILQARVLKWIAIPISRGSPGPRDQSWAFVLQMDSLPSEPPEKPYRIYRQA